MAGGEGVQAKEHLHKAQEGTAPSPGCPRHHLPFRRFPEKLRDAASTAAWAGLGLRTRVSAGYTVESGPSLPLPSSPLPFPSVFLPSPLPSCLMN